MPSPKVKLIETASSLVYQQGWNATGINQILGEAKVPKGSFYYYFQSKEDLGVAIVQHQAALLEKVYAETFLNETLKGREAVCSYFEMRTNKKLSEELRWGCPIGSFANEVADSVDRIALACRESLERFIQVVEAAVVRGQQDGSIRSKTKPSEMALHISSLWQGMLLHAKVLKNDEPLKAGLRFIEEILS